MGKLYQYIAFSLLMTAIGFFVGWAFVPVQAALLANGLLFVVLLVSLIAALALKVIKRNRYEPIRFPIWLVFAFAFLDGIGLYPVLLLYLAELGVSLFLSIVIGTMLVFAAMAYLAHKTEASASVGLGKALGIVLAVIILVSLFNLFVRSDQLSVLLSAAGILVFSLYILVDITQFRIAYNNGYIHDSSDYSIFVLNIYLDIINLLLDLLELIRKLKD